MLFGDIACRIRREQDEKRNAPGLSLSRRELWFCWRLRWLRARATVNGTDGSGNVDEGIAPVRAVDHEPRGYRVGRLRTRTTESWMYPTPSYIKYEEE